MAYIEVDSKKIYIEEYGKSNKRTIVIFHGGPAASCRGFENQATALSEKYHIVSFDQCGVSRSDAILEDEPFGMIEHIKQIDKMREILGISSWTILGHSYGGTLACLYAYTYPKSTDEVMYIGAMFNAGMSARTQAIYLMPYFKRINSEEGLNKCIELIQNKSENIKEIHDYYRTSIVPLVKDYREIACFHKTADELKNIPARQFNTPPDLEDAEQKSNIHRQKLRESGEIYKNFYEYLRKIDKPSLSLLGVYDVGMCERECFLKNAPKGSIVEFKNSGHFPHIEEPKEFTEAVINFMDKGEIKI